MIEIIICILIPSAIILGNLWIKKKTIPGSDHALHLTLIHRIKINKNRFVENNMFYFNEKYPYYPQLYHWILSFFPEFIIKEKYNNIGVVIKAIEIIAFNFFLYYIYTNVGFEKITFLFANFIFNAFPFSYAFWNAKNTGLSARGIGLIAGQIYLYLIIVYVFSGSLWILFGIFIIVFIIWLLSQMAMQFVLLSLPLIAIIFRIPEIIIMPFISYGLFYLIMPKVAKGYILGQFNFKRNYALFMSYIFILKRRPSIYRDFFYDFWVNVKRDRKRGFLYIYQNPIIELFYGFVFLWFVIYVAIINSFPEILSNMFSLVIISLILFFITSFRLTRFLGEPQRYVEFVIPIISILFSISYSWQFASIILFLAFLIIIIPNYIINNNILFRNRNSDRDNLFELLKKNTSQKSKICISNDNEILKFIMPLGYDICKPDYSMYYKTKSSFFNLFYDSQLEKISPLALKEYCEQFNPDFLILNNNFYSFNKLENRLANINWKILKKIGDYSLYKNYKN